MKSEKEIKIRKAALQLAEISIPGGCSFYKEVRALIAELDWVLDIDENWVRDIDES